MYTILLKLYGQKYQKKTIHRWRSTSAPADGVDTADPLGQHGIGHQLGELRTPWVI